MSNLDNPRNAAKWTALQAYLTKRNEKRAKQGEALGRLALEVPHPFGDSNKPASRENSSEFWVEPAKDGVSTVLQARGVDLPAAANTMARGCGAFVQDNPEAAVSLAIGVPNLNVFTEIWRDAMGEGSAIAAGKVAMVALKYQPPAWET